MKLTAIVCIAASFTHMFTRLLVTAHAKHDDYKCINTLALK